MYKLILKLGKFNSKDENRDKISLLTYIFGICCNIGLSLTKFVLSIFSGSISIFSDAINNLTDCISAIIAIFGTKISSLPEDKEHPYGHGRFEYITTLVVSTFVMVAGLEFLRLSIKRIIKPQLVVYSKLTLILLILSILVKIYLSFFYKKIGTSIDSKVILAQSQDSISDVLVSSVVVVSIIINKLTNLYVDGYVGLIVSLVIIYSAFNMIKDTISDILGNVSYEDINEIHNIIFSNDEIIGIHDIIISNFGPNKTFLALDAEVNYNLSLNKCHDILNTLEDEIKEKLGYEVCIHPDPVGDYTKEEHEIINILKASMSKYPYILSFHDLTFKNNILKVHITVNGHEIKSKKDEEKIIEILNSQFKGKYKLQLEIDRYFY